MRPSDTSIGGEERTFPSTLWSDILAADPSGSECQERLDRLLRTYWKPVYTYVRVRWRKSVEDAKDLTQAFFTHVLAKGYISRLRPDRGSFRGYLKKALKHFLINAGEAASARQPNGPVVSIEAAPHVLERLGPAAPDESPEAAYDREWFRGVVDAAIGELRETLAREGKKQHFEVFRTYCLDPDPAGNLPTGGAGLAGEPPGGLRYADVARQLGLQEDDVRYYLFYCRALLREILKARIRGYVEGDDDVERELGEILSG